MVAYHFLLALLLRIPKGGRGRSRPAIVGGGGVRSGSDVVMCGLIARRGGVGACVISHVGDGEGGVVLLGPLHLPCGLAALAMLVDASVVASA